MSDISEFSVCQFFRDGTYKYVRRYVTAKEAMRAIAHYTDNVTARLIITDGGDCICFEWIHGRGIVFPPKERK